MVSSRKKTVKVFNREKFAKLIENSRLDQTQIAGELGFTPKQISSWKTGDAEPRAESLVLIARFFNVSVDYLLDLSELEMGQLSAGEKNLSPDERELVDAFRAGDLQAVVAIFMKKMSNHLNKRGGE